TDPFILDKWIEHAGGVAATTNAGDHAIGQTTERINRLLASFTPDNRLEVANHHWKRMRANHAANDVMGVFNGRHPVAHRFVHRVAEGPRAAVDRRNRCAE